MATITTVEQAEEYLAKAGFTVLAAIQIQVKFLAPVDTVLAPVVVKKPRTFKSPRRTEYKLMRDRRIRMDY